MHTLPERLEQKTGLNVKVISRLSQGRSKSGINKKVLLPEHKRHTTRGVVSTPSVVLTGYPPQQGTPPILTWLGGTLPGYPLPLQQGTPQQGTPWQSTPPSRVSPGRVPPSRVPPGWVPPSRVPPWQGTAQLDLAGYPPRCLPHGILGNVAKHYGIWVTPPPPPWTDRWMEGQTRVKTLPSRRTTYAGGNKLN